jgi:hypothetical protein
MNEHQNDTNDVVEFDALAAIAVKNRVQNAKSPANGSGGAGEAGAEELAARVFEAFGELAERYGWVVAQFRDAFDKRRKVMSLRESHPKFGLAFALTELLWQSPTDACFSFTQDASHEVAKVGPDFASEFEHALNCVANKYPRVLRMMSENQGRSSNIPPSIFLGGLLTLYAKNVSVSPH